MLFRPEGASTFAHCLVCLKDGCQSQADHHQQDHYRCPVCAHQATADRFALGSQSVL
jgi:hypothetical protein